MSEFQFRLQLADAARGLSQQMVFWGHDVRHPNGNVLVRYGLVRRPSPGLQGTSCYSAEWEDGLIELHGTVASWTAPSGKCGCVFCRDRKLITLWTSDQPPVPGRHEAPAAPPSRRWEAFQPLLRWLVGYEEWIASQHPPGWREGIWKSIKRIPKAKPWLPPTSAVRWWTLALSGSPPRPKQLSSQA